MYLLWWRRCAHHSLLNTYNYSLLYWTDWITMGDYVIRDWHDKALCQRHPDPDMWHYENSHWSDEQQLAVLRSIEAIQVCHDCPVRTECLAQGMEDENIVYNGGSGSIWGGLLNSERYTVKTGRVGSRRLQSEERHRMAVRKVIGRLKV